jgi:hypothetical protein
MSIDLIKRRADSLPPGPSPIAQISRRATPAASPDAAPARIRAT